MKKNMRLLLLILLPLQIIATEQELWPRPLVKGCWVRYVMTFPDTNSIKNKVYCLISVHKVNLDKLDLDFTISGIKSAANVSNRIQVNSDNFDVGASFGINSKMPPLTAIEKNITYKIQSMKASVSAKSLTWNKNNKKTTVIRSREIPFGLAKLSSGDFNIEVESYSWGNK